MVDYLQNGQQPEHTNFVAALAVGANSVSAARTNNFIFMSGSCELGTASSAPLGNTLRPLVEVRVKPLDLRVHLNVSNGVQDGSALNR